MEINSGKILAKRTSLRPAMEAFSGADYRFYFRVVRHYTDEIVGKVGAERRVCSQKASPWRELSERIARPEESPYPLHYDRYHKHIDRIVRPP